MPYTQEYDLPMTSVKREDHYRNVAEPKLHSIAKETDIDAWKLSLQCPLLSQQLHEQIILAMRSQSDHVLYLQHNLTQILQQNQWAQSSLKIKNTQYELLIGDIVRVCQEKQEIFDKCEKEKLEKELCQMILDQYRDEIIEQKKIITEKDESICHLLRAVAKAESKMASLTAQRLHSPVVISNRAIAVHQPQSAAGGVGAAQCTGENLGNHRDPTGARVTRLRTIDSEVGARQDRKAVDKQPGRSSVRRRRRRSRQVAAK